jgi:hypothetical protein
LEKYNLQRNNLSIINPFEYMKTRKYPQTNGSYLDYITGTGSNGRGAAFGGDYIIQEIEEFDVNVDEKDVEDNEKEFKQLAIVFSQASSPESSEVWTNYLTATWSEVLVHIKSCLLEHCLNLLDYLLQRGLL